MHASCISSVTTSVTISPGPADLLLLLLQAGGEGACSRARGWQCSPMGGGLPECGRTACGCRARLSHGCAGAGWANESAHIYVSPACHCSHASPCLLLPAFYCSNASPCLLLPACYSSYASACLLLLKSFCLPFTAQMLLPACYCLPATPHMLLPACP